MSRHIERGIRHENKPTNDGGRRASNGRGNVWQHLVIMSIIRSVCQRAQRSLMRGRTVASCAWQRGRGESRSKRGRPGSGRCLDDAPIRKWLRNVCVCVFVSLLSLFSAKYLFCLRRLGAQFSALLLYFLSHFFLFFDNFGSRLLPHLLLLLLSRCVCCELCAIRS